MSVTDKGISHTEMMEMNKYKLGGLMDPRLGCADRYHKCQTCAGNSRQCPGHFGHIDLVKPVYHLGYLPAIVKILRCFCLFCSQLKVDPSSSAFRQAVEQSKKNKNLRLDMIYQVCKGRQTCELSKSVDDEDDDDEYEDDRFRTGHMVNGISSSKKCHRQGCGRTQPKYSLKGLEIFIEWKNSNAEEHEKKQLLSPERVVEMFKRISDADVDLIGLDSKFSRPEWLIITVLPVPPLAVILFI